ncbi:MAG: PAS domain-containing protein, partial [Promethearchaeota archaeon]
TFCEKYNVSKEDAIGSKCYNLTHGFNMVCKPPECTCPVEKVLNTGEFCESIHSHQIEGDTRYIELLAFPIKDNGDSIEQIVKIGRDITDKINAKKILKASEYKFRKSFENLPFSIFLLDSNYKIIDCNSISEIYMNESKKGLIGMDFINLFSISKNKVKEINEILTNVVNYDLSEILELKFINYNGQLAWAELFFSSVILRNDKYIQIILQDITERKLIEDIIKKENQKLRELDQLKKQLMAQLSEKLKSPLNNIFDITEILLNSYREQLDDEIIELLDMIKKGGERSIDMVGKMLEISKIEADKLELNFQTESLIEIIKDSVKEVNDQIKNQNIILNLNLKEDLYSDIDKIRIKYIIKYLLTSIIKAKSLKKEIIVSLIQNNHSAEISTSFSGIGIKKLKSLFELEFSREIIELHGGSLIINSESKKKETNIVIKLPLKNWKESLIHIYIIYRSGIPLFDYSFIERNKADNTTLISGSIIGMMTLLRAIIHGKKQIKTIDHGDRKLMFEMNSTNDVSFILLVKEDLQILRKKLNDLIEVFDKKYRYLIKKIDITHNISNFWEELQVLIEKYFG